MCLWDLLEKTITLSTKPMLHQRKRFDMQQLKALYFSRLSDAQGRGTEKRREEERRERRKGKRLGGKERGKEMRKRGREEKR